MLVCECSFFENLIDCGFCWRARIVGLSMSKVTAQVEAPCARYSKEALDKLAAIGLRVIERRIAQRLDRLRERYLLEEVYKAHGDERVADIHRGAESRMPSQGEAEDMIKDAVNKL